MAKFIESQKGKRKLILGEYMYTKEKNGADGKEIWVRELRSCKSRIHTKAHDIVQQPTEHNHAPRHWKAAVAEVLADMKKCAEETEQGTRQIVHQSLTQVNLEHAHHLPSRATLSHDVRRHRHKIGLSDQSVEQYSKTKV